MLYKVLSGCSVRLSPDEASPDFHRFQDWLPGEQLDTAAAPDHLDVDGLVALGVIEAIQSSSSKGAKGASSLQDAQEPSQEPGAVLTDLSGTAAALREIKTLIQTAEAEGDNGES